MTSLKYESNSGFLIAIFTCITTEEDTVILFNVIDVTAGVQSCYRRGWCYKNYVQYRRFVKSNKHVQENTGTKCDLEIHDISSFADVLE